MEELRDSQSDSPPRNDSSYDLGENHNIKNFPRNTEEDKYHLPIQTFLTYQNKEFPKECIPTEYTYAQGKGYEYNRREEFPYRRSSIPPEYSTPQLSSPHEKKEAQPRPRIYPQSFTGQNPRSNSISGISFLSLENKMQDKVPSIYSHGIAEEKDVKEKGKSPSQESVSNTENVRNSTPHRVFRDENIEDSADSDEVAEPKLGRGRKKISMEFIKDKSRRGVTFSKRKKGIMKKAFELNVLTKCEVLLIVASETGHVYTFATPKLQPIIKQHESLIQQYLNTPAPGEIVGMYEPPERFVSDPSGYYKPQDSYGYDGIIRGNGYSSGYYGGGYDQDGPPGPSPRM